MHVLPTLVLSIVYFSCICGTGLHNCDGECQDDTHVKKAGSEKILRDGDQNYIGITVGTPKIREQANGKAKIIYNRADKWFSAEWEEFKKKPNYSNGDTSKINNNAQMMNSRAPESAQIIESFLQNAFSRCGEFLGENVDLLVHVAYCCTYTNYVEALCGSSGNVEHGQRRKNGYK